MPIESGVFSAGALTKGGTTHYEFTLRDGCKMQALDPTSGWSLHKEVPDELREKAQDKAARLDRVYKVCICFSALKFSSKPEVHLSITGLDVLSGANLRLEVTAPNANVTPNGFELHIRTWADTRIYSVTVHWLAHEAVH